MNKCEGCEYESNCLLPCLKYSMEKIDIYEDIEPNDNFPYFTCPKCQNSNITRAFNRCIDCGVKLIWKTTKSK